MSETGYLSLTARRKQSEVTGVHEPQRVDLGFGRYTLGGLRGVVRDLQQFKRLIINPSDND